MRIAIGIPCYGDPAVEVTEDWLRWLYYLGRRYVEHEFFLAIKTKSEQFRARNAIVTEALKVSADYLLMLDDDMVINHVAMSEVDPHSVGRTDSPYEFLRKLLAHDKDVIGALYYQRGGYCKPVAMRVGNDGGLYFLRDDEIAHGLQQVDVVGGGCMLINMRVFDRIDSPWFEWEKDNGTDIQICEKAKAEGFTVWLDSSIELGHLRSERQIISSRNRDSVFAGMLETEGMQREWSKNSALSLYRDDVLTYLGTDWDGAMQMYEESCATQETFSNFADPDDYYRSLGPEWVGRNMVYNVRCTNKFQTISRALLAIPGNPVGLDFGCGTAAVGFELAMKGHVMSFVDLEGSPGMRFVRWRLDRYEGLRANTAIDGPYDYVLLLDVIEHLRDWREALAGILECLKDKGAIVTNYFSNQDFDNPEHISMNHDEVRKFFTDQGVYPVNGMFWVKGLLNDTVSGGG